MLLKIIFLKRHWQIIFAKPCAKPYQRSYVKSNGSHNSVSIQIAINSPSDHSAEVSSGAGFVKVLLMIRKESTRFLMRGKRRVDRRFKYFTDTRKKAKVSNGCQSF